MLQFFAFQITPLPFPLPYGERIKVRGKKEIPI